MSAGRPWLVALLEDEKYLEAGLLSALEALRAHNLAMGPGFTHYDSSATLLTHLVTLESANGGEVVECDAAERGRLLHMVHAATTRWLRGLPCIQLLTSSIDDSVLFKFPHDVLVDPRPLSEVIQEKRSAAADPPAPTWPSWTTSSAFTYPGNSQVAFKQIEPAQPERIETPTAVEDLQSANELVYEGEVWRVRYRGSPPVHVQHRVGLESLGRLLEKPGEDVPSYVLLGEPRPSDVECEVLDRTARRHLATRIDLLKEVLEGDDPRAALQASEELERLQAQRGADTHDGRSKRLKADDSRFADRARKRLERAIEALPDSPIQLRQHLRESIRMGSNFAYKPKEPTIWTVHAPSARTDHFGHGMSRKRT